MNFQPKPYRDLIYLHRFVENGVCKIGHDLEAIFSIKRKSRKLRDVPALGAIKINQSETDETDRVSNRER